MVESENLCCFFAIIVLLDRLFFNIYCAIFGATDIESECRMLKKLAEKVVKGIIK